MASGSSPAREYTVLVTGFGANHNAPYGNATSNPAGTVAGMLPLHLHADYVLNTAGVDINILDPTPGGFDAIPGELGFIRRRIRELHAEHGNKVSLWVHLGRGPWDFVTCERRAFRQDFTSSWLADDAQEGYYLGRDNANQNVRDLGPCPWMEVPMGLHSEIDIDTVVIDANKALAKHREAASVSEDKKKENLEVVSHLEAGSAGCGFAFYESMANCFAAGRKRDVLFLHLPRHEDQISLENGRDAVLAIIGASIAALIARENAPSTGDWKQKFGDCR